MKIHLNYFGMILISVFALTGCKTVITESEASDNLINSIVKANVGNVSNALDSKNYNYKIIIDNAEVDFLNTNNPGSSKVTLVGNISINDSIIQKNKVTMIFEMDTYLNKSDGYVGIRSPRLIKLDVSNVYSAYYGAFERSLFYSAQDVIGYSLSNATISSVYVDDIKSNLSITMKNTNDSLILKVGE
ncbi:hypothetical protein [Psychromonas sp. SP041]|uniref:hypothetical protein n=1 Tax=Psychromonas sp. SP041 TaxID=1365007 RepID=UPI0010C7AE78|nr:hypothetical protein [Psychromonas sp. SP041]